ncbi:hypothetical protein JCM9492_13710 [Aquifex pyrophilus]
MQKLKFKVISEVSKGIGISLEASAIFSFISHQIDFAYFIFFVGIGILYIVAGAILEEYYGQD